MKVLVADDSLLMRRLLQSTLESWNYDVVMASDGEEAWHHLSGDSAPALAVLDWMMPVHTGLELCRMVRALKRATYTYVILLTSRGLREDIVEGLSAGADDYVVKPFDRHELEVRLRAGRRIIDLQQELMKAQEAMRVQATRDSLTGIWNRGTILEILEREAERARREKRPLSVVMMDLDHFKAVNDTYGHQVGDEVLRELTARVQDEVRTYDAFGRYGGEEFILVVPGCDESNLPAHAERLRRAVGHAPFATSVGELSVTASFGALAVKPGSNLSVHELIRLADDALYDAKRAGRNCVVCSPAEAAQREL